MLFWQCRRVQRSLSHGSFENMLSDTISQVGGARDMDLLARNPLICTSMRCLQPSVGGKKQEPKPACPTRVASDLNLADAVGGLGAVRIPIALLCMRGGGYGAQDWYNVTKNVKWENTKEILIKREEKKKKGKGEAPGTAVVIEEKPGPREWWEACTGRGYRID
jgi:hypothetical protein